MTTEERILDHYGIDNEIIVLIEEMSELTKELTKLQRGIGDLNHITEEMADVHLSMNVVRIGLAIDQNAMVSIMAEKLDREEGRMNERD